MKTEKGRIIYSGIRFLGMGIGSIEWVSDDKEKRIEVSLGSNGITFIRFEEQDEDGYYIPKGEIAVSPYGEITKSGSYVYE